MALDADQKDWIAVATEAAVDAEQVKRRNELATFSADVFSQVGAELTDLGHIFGSDRARGSSPQGHGSDEVFAVGLLLRIAGQLTSAFVDLWGGGRQYAAAALLRQVVEIEYLAWAFETRDNDAERWLRSDPKERETFSRPAKLRLAAAGRFRGPRLWISLRTWWPPSAWLLYPIAGQPDQSHPSIRPLGAHWSNLESRLLVV